MELSAKSMGQPLWCGYKVTEEVSGTRWGRCFPGEDFWRRSSTTSPNSSPGVHRSHDSSLSVNKLSWLEDKTHWQRWLSLLLAWLSSQWAFVQLRLAVYLLIVRVKGWERRERKRSRQEAEASDCVFAPQLQSVSLKSDTPRPTYFLSGCHVTTGKGSFFF